MDNTTPSKPSFSSGQRWGVFFSVIFSIILMAAIMVMLNYLSSRYYKRVSWSSSSQNRLSLRTIALLKTITNKVSITVYYDKEDVIYPMVDELLEEYHLANPLIQLDKVDYLADATRAQKVKAAYKLSSNEDKNLVIFDCEGRHRIVSGATLAESKIEQAGSHGGTNEFIRHIQGFTGEQKFSGALLSVINPKPSHAYFVTGHGEHQLESENSDRDGYKKFGQVLEGHNVIPQTINLIGTNAIPRDCSLLVIPGPRRAIPAVELAKIREYLAQGGRLLVLFNYYTVKNTITTGLESLLEDWNVRVGDNVIADPPNTSLADGAMIVSRVHPNHPLVSPMYNGSGLAMYNPRSIEALQPSTQVPGAPEAKALVSTSEFATIGENATPAKGRVPIIVAVEKGRVQGVISERGTTAIVVVGDSLFLDNENIGKADNSDFAGFTIDWLLDQAQLLQGVGPHAVKEYMLTMTSWQLSQVRWVFLAAMPGAVLLLGFFVWLRRRN